MGFNNVLLLFLSVSVLAFIQTQNTHGMNLGVLHLGPVFR